MGKERMIEKYFDYARKTGMIGNPRGWQFYLDYLFSGVSFEGRSMLDIGGGDGLFSFYAGCNGAQVICLEPETEGSTSGMTGKFKAMRTYLEPGSGVELEPVTIQDFDAKEKKFDIILMHDSINHLDEEACVNLRRDAHAVTEYEKIFRKISGFSRAGAKLIITDCSRYNFFGSLNIKNPFAPDIEWHKHQPPEYWAKLLGNNGFCHPHIRWATINRLGQIGRILFGNKVASYFYYSHFCLTMTKNGRS